MSHLIQQLYNLDIPTAVEQLNEVHQLIVEAVLEAEGSLKVDPMEWGGQFKRLEIKLPSEHWLIGKEKEKFVEIINITATIERTIAHEKTRPLSA